MVQQHQRRRNTRRKRQARALCLAFAMTLLLGCVVAQRFAHTQQGRTRAKAMRLTPVRYQARTTQAAEQSTAPASVPSISVLVDAREAAAADLPSLADALRGCALSPDILSAVSSSSDTISKARPNWFEWAHLDAKRAHLQVNAAPTLDANSLGAYATRGDWGMSLCLINKTNSRLLTTAQLRLPGGVYTIERLTLGEEKEKRRKGEKETEEGNREEANPQSAMDSSFILHPSSFHFSRLEGCDFGSAGTVRKVFCLEPGQVCIYRCVDSAREARGAWYDVFAQLRVMGARQSGPARRLSTMLREANGYVAGVRGGGGKYGRDSRLECVHHLLLITAQAHSLHHNYQMRHTVDEQTGTQVMAALDRLTTSLSETSAALLGLVPQVSVASNPVSSAQARTIGAIREQTETFAANKKEINPNAPNMQMRPERAVTVSLENTGGRSVSNVKLGLNMAGMSGSVTCEPADPAYFDVLRPGQSIRAVFHVRSVSGADLSDTLFTGDVSYFAGTAPAHLRPRAW